MNTNISKGGKPKLTQVESSLQYGVYCWRLPDGHLFHDGQGNILSINSIKGDLEKINALRKAAAYYGQPDGDAWFYAGSQQVSDEEYSEQLDRLQQGYIPSMNDLGAVVDAKQGVAEHGNY